MSTVVHRAGWVLALALGMLVIAVLAGVVHGGPLDPPGTPGPTQPQVEPRSPIPPVGWNGTFPIVINSPGSYFVTRNLQAPGASTGIQIAASDVTLDLNGFALDGANTGSDGISVTGQLADITIKNGVVRGWTLDAIATSITVNNLAVQSTFEDLTVTNSYHGLAADSGAIIRNVKAEKDTYGLTIEDLGNRYLGGLIEDCVLTENSSYAIQVLANNVTVRDSVIDSNGQVGVLIDHAFDVVEGNTIQGTDVNAGVVINPTGSMDTVVHNIFANDHSGAVSDLGTNDRIGPMETVGTSTHTWSNVGP